MAVQDKERYEREKQIYDRAREAVPKKNTGKDEDLDKDSDEETERKKKANPKGCQCTKEAHICFSALGINVNGQGKCEKKQTLKQTLGN